MRCLELEMNILLALVCFYGYCCKLLLLLYLLRCANGIVFVSVDSINSKTLIGQQLNLIFFKSNLNASLNLIANLRIPLLMHSKLIWWNYRNFINALKANAYIAKANALKAMSSFTWNLEMIHLNYADLKDCKFQWLKPHTKIVKECLTFFCCFFFSFWFLQYVIWSTASKLNPKLSYNLGHTVYVCINKI